MSDGTETSAPAEPAVLVDLTDGILTITLNRPKRHNAVNGALHDGLRDALRRAQSDAAVRVVLLRGAGRSFCSGGDVETFAQNRPAEPPSGAQVGLSVLSGRELLETMTAVEKPVVAEVRGYALGLGATIALFADVVVAAQDAVIADTHVNVGLVAGDGGAVAWPLLMSMGKARYYLLTGERLSGAQAAAEGLVFDAVPADELAGRAREVAGKLAAIAPLAAAGTKATLNLIVRDRMNLVLEYGLLREGLTFLSDDHREASAAFMAKREPIFRTR